ncbi:MAG: hypothetical protein STSR0009_23610 [Methanoregula sp.]
MSEPVWKDLAELRTAGQTYNDILTEMIELQKKQRLMEDIQRSLDEGVFIPLSEIKERKSKRVATKRMPRVKGIRTDCLDVVV